MFAQDFTVFKVCIILMLDIGGLTWDKIAVVKSI